MEGEEYMNRKQQEAEIAEVSIFIITMHCIGSHIRECRAGRAYL